MSRVSINDVCKSYGAFEALKGISFGIEDGEFVVLVGPSGCGKSTLLRMIAGPRENHRRARSTSAAASSTIFAPKDRDIAMVFQNYALYPHMTVAENMGFSLKLKGVPRPRSGAKVDRAARILDLDRLLDRRRTSSPVASASVSRWVGPSCATRRSSCSMSRSSNLDAKLRVQMRTEIKALHQRLRTTIVYVTHDQIEAMTMADRIVVMSDGHDRANRRRRSSSTTARSTPLSPASSALLR